MALKYDDNEKDEKDDDDDDDKKKEAEEEEEAEMMMMTRAWAMNQEDAGEVLHADEMKRKLNSKDELIQCHIEKSDK